jgi:hypothetical protein
VLETDFGGFHLPGLLRPVTVEFSKVYREKVAVHEAVDYVPNAAGKE